MFSKNTTAGAWAGLVAMAGPSQSCVHGAGNEEAACPAAGSSEHSAHIPASPRNLCMIWLEAPCQELGEKQTAPACFLRAPASSTG